MASVSLIPDRVHVDNSVYASVDLACFDLIGCVLYNTQFHDALYLSANLSTALSVACGNPNMSPKVSVFL